MNGGVWRAPQHSRTPCVLPDFVRSATTMTEEPEGHLGCSG